MAMYVPKLHDGKNCFISYHAKFGFTACQNCYPISSVKEAWSRVRDTFDWCLVRTRDACFVWTPKIGWRKIRMDDYIDMIMAMYRAKGTFADYFQKFPDRYTTPMNELISRMERDKDGLDVRLQKVGND